MKALCLSLQCTSQYGDEAELFVGWPKCQYLQVFFYRRVKFPREESSHLSESIQAAVTKYYSWVAYKQQKFVTVLEAGKSKIRVPARLGSGEGPVPGCRLPSSCCVIT